MSSRHECDLSYVQHNPDAIIKLGNERAALNRRRNTFAPAVNLPSEVLTMIFEFACCPDGGGWIANRNFFTQQNDYRDECPVSACAVTPLFIGAICSAWRDIAWGASQLWSTITLAYDEPNDEKLAEMLEYWLSMSGERPLTVKLIEPSNFVGDDSIKVINVIATYAHRLHTLQLFLPDSWEPALIRIASCAPRLTRLVLSTLGSVDDNPFVGLGDLFANMPQLREVTFFGDYSAVDVSLPWAQLESLELGYGGNVLKPVETLGLCPLLRRLSVNWNIPAWTVTPSALTRHTALEELKLFDFDDFLHPEFLKVLELPSLRSFVLYFITMPRELTSWLLPFLSRVAETLEILQLANAAPRNGELLTILRVVPRLRKLELLNSLPYSQEKKLTQRALDLMNPTKYEGLECEVIGQLGGQGGQDGAGMERPDERSSRHCLVPNLETFEYVGEIDFTSYALVEFLVARWRGCSTPSHCTSGLGLRSPRQQLDEPFSQNVDVLSRLRSAIFKTPEQIRFVEDADAEAIQQLRLEGMHLDFLKRSYY